MALMNAVLFAAVATAELKYLEPVQPPIETVTDVFYI